MKTIYCLIRAFHLQIFVLIIYFKEKRLKFEIGSFISYSYISHPVGNIRSITPG